MRGPHSAFGGASRPGRSAFTLIELLIVVSIISILTTIGMPNFLEAQTRAKAARMKSDMRTLITALETYRIDYQDYPMRRHTQPTPQRKPPVPELATRLEQMGALTTPVAYVSNLPVDIFETTLPPPNNVIDYYDPVQTSWLINSRFPFQPSRHVDPGTAGWLLVSVGPDGNLGAVDNTGGWPLVTPLRGTIFFAYDPTNGTNSTGNIYATQQGGIDNGGMQFQLRVTP